MRVALPRGFDVFLRFDDRHEDVGVFGQADLCAGLGVGADGLHAEAVREDAVMADLIDIRRRQFQAGRELAGPVAEVGEADEFVGREEMVDAVGELFGDIAGVVGEGFRGVARLPATGQRLRQDPNGTM